MSIRLGQLSALALASTVLLAGPVPGADAADPDSGSAQGGGSRDPVGDVDVTTDQPLTQDELDSIDLTQVTWKVVKGRSVTFRLRLVDVPDPSPRSTFYGLTAYAGPNTVFLMARRKGVFVFDDLDIRRCRGGRSTIDAERDLVRFTAPVDCFARADRYDFAPIALLETAEGDDLAGDDADRTGRVAVR